MLVLCCWPEVGKLRGDFIALMVVVGAILFASSIASGDEAKAERCMAAVAQAGGDQSHCLLDAHAHYLRKGILHKYEAIVDKCDRRFDRKFRRAMRRYGVGECAEISQSDVLNESRIYVDRITNLAEGVSNAPVSRGGESWPTNSPVVAAYDDLTAVDAAGQVSGLSDLDSYDVVIFGFWDASGQKIGTHGELPTGLRADTKKLLSLGGATHHFTEDGLTDIPGIVAAVSSNNFQGVDFDIEFVDTGTLCGTCGAGGTPVTPGCKQDAEGNCSCIAPASGTSCGTTTSTAWVAQLKTQIKTLRSQLKASLGKEPILTFSPAVILAGDYHGVTVSAAQVIARSDLPVDDILLSGLIDAVIVQAYNGVGAERDPRIIGAVYRKARAKYNKTAVLVGVPVSPAGTYSGEYGSYNLWNGSSSYGATAPCLQSQAEADLVADWIVYQGTSSSHGMKPGDGISAWALTIDAYPAGYTGSNCSESMSFFPAGYYTKNVAKRLHAGTPIAKPPSPPTPPPPAAGCHPIVGFCAASCSGQASSSPTFSDNQCLIQAGTCQAAQATQYCKDN